MRTLLASVMALLATTATQAATPAELAAQLPESDMQPAAADTSLRANVPRTADTGLVRAPLIMTFLGMPASTAAIVGAAVVGAVAIAATQDNDDQALSGTGGTGSGPAP